MFSIQEIEMLMQGLDAIERVESTSDMMGDMLTAMICRDKEQEQKIQFEREERKRKQADQKREQKMRINILKGKLARIALDVNSESPFSQVSTTEVL